jgi:ribosome biogenesis GTPase / thiamine phosphate phosphatase
VTAGSSAIIEARVVAGHGRRFVVETAAGERYPCLTAGRSQQAICGDRVRLEITAQGPVIHEVLARDSLFSKADARGRPQPLAANLDQVLVTLAVTPAADDFLLDKYLAAVSGMGIASGIIFNKIDLPDGAGRAATERLLDYLETLGYPVFRVSAHTGSGLDGLRRNLSGRGSLLVGQSGVGKSSLLNLLVPGAAQRIHSLSAATDEGRHTTTATTWHPLAGGGALLDSPGVRDVALPLRPPQQIAGLFIEFPVRAADCRFNDCLHVQEPGCAIKAAVERGEIRAERYRHYLRMLQTMQQLHDRQHG